jgi:hypothetical protein
MRYFAEEADVRIRSPFGNPDPSVIRVRHQPHGTTVFDPETRRQIDESHPRPRIIPLDLTFSLRCPSDATARAELVAVADRILSQAAGMPACIGGYLMPLGEVQHDDSTSYEFLAGIWQGHHEVDTVRRRPRTPGWRVVVPHAAMSRIAPQPGVECRDVAAGALLASAAVDPFAMTDGDREAIERALQHTFVVPTE